MTRILIITIGSRGDIQPFVALGKSLQIAGYEVALQTPETYKPFVQGYELPYLYMNNDFMKLTESQAGQAATDGGSKLDLMKQVMPVLRQMLEDEWQGARDFQPDAIICHPKSLGGYHLAEKLGIPFFQALALPLFTPTSAYPTPIMSGIRLGGRFNRFSYRLMALSTAPYVGIINDFRVKTLGLTKRGRFASELMKPNGEPVPMLYAYSPHVLPVPQDYPSHVHVTGYWFLDRNEDWQPSDDLVRFLESGTPPVYIGFGSMSGTRAPERTRIVLAALAKTGQRGLLASGWGGLKASDLPANVFMLEQAPHDWLFPRVSAVVHHGGAGTTAAGLRAGKPAVIVPFIADQPFWGKVVHELGVGVEPIPQKKLTLEALSAAISQAVNDADMRRRAEAVGEKVRAENGTGNAMKVIAHQLGQNQMSAVSGK
ncbi:MAG: glycosyltransferase family 1 protein [Anaerolineae bacterium]|nr:glycosyltransferase family 1 protein [Anaerolineae bacterium]